MEDNRDIELKKASEKYAEETYSGKRGYHDSDRNFAEINFTAGAKWAALQPKEAIDWQTALENEADEMYEPQEWKENKAFRNGAEWLFDFLNDAQPKQEAIDLNPFKNPEQAKKFEESIEGWDMKFIPKQEGKEMSEDEIENASMWCEVIHAINEADKKGIDVGEFIPTVLEKQFTIKRK